MNLARFLSSSTPRKWLLLRPIAAAPLSTVASAAKLASKGNSKSVDCPAKDQEEHLGVSGADWKLEKKEATELSQPTEMPFRPKTAELPRPNEIPFQPKVANLVHLIGKVGVPVQIQDSPNGGYSAVSVLVQGKTEDFPLFWIPVIFHGDLAKIAACHLNESDLIYVTGQLSGDAPPVKFEHVHANVQVLAQTLNLVRVYPGKERNLSCKEEEVASHCSDIVDEDSNTLHMWNDLLANPDKWWDNRSYKKPAFKHKETRQVLLLNESTPEWVRSKLDTLFFGQITTKGQMNRKANNFENLEKSWSDLVDNPHNWIDHRVKKSNAKFPDFKHKETGDPLWLDTAPQLVLSKLGGLEFSNSKVKDGKENLWKDLVENPKKWWDNRSCKSKSSQPDFKHKETGESLWLGSLTPSWVKDSLPSLKF